MLAALLVIFTLRAYSSLRQESATWDETVYFGLGKYLLQTQRWDVPGSILHPPLSYYLHSLPLLFVETDRAPWEYHSPNRTDPKFLALSDFERGRALLSSPRNDGDRLLTMARMMMVATAVLLGVFVYAWGRALFGPAAGLLAATLFTFDPNILAHARLITPDIVVTTFSFITMYFFWRLLTAGRMRDGLWLGVSLGLALLSKFTGLLLIPIGGVMLAVALAAKRPVNWKGCGVAAVVGAVILCAGYGFHLGPYFTGLVFQQEHATIGHPSFLAGEYSPSGWWYFFLVAFAIKTPLALSILIVCGLLVRHGRRSGWRDEAFLLVPVVGLTAFFSFNHQSIGLRYLLPVYPFLFVLASRGVTLLSAGGAARLASSMLVAWHAGASLWIQPHYLAYFNELVGGPSQGYKYLVDSNLDWGQDLPGLKRFMDAHGIARIHLSYFGSDAPSRYGIAYDPLPSYFLEGDTGAGHIFTPGSWVAVSATNLQGIYFMDRNYYALFRDRPPDAVIGYSIFLYYLR